MNHPKNHSTDQRGLFIAPDMTMRAYLKKYPLATLFLNQHLADNRERLLDAPILEFLKVVKQRPGGFFMRDTLAGSMNNIAGAYYHAPLLHGQSDWLHTYGPAPAGFWTERPLPVELSADGIGIRRPEGLGAPRYWACNGAFSVLYTQASGGIDALTCWNWKSGPRGSETLFKGGFLSFGVGRTRHSFQDAILWPYGFHNRWGRDGGHTSELYLEGRSMVLDVTGGKDAWVALDWNARAQREGTVWRVKGWDESLGVFIVQVASMHNGAVNDLFYPPYPTGFSFEEICSFFNSSTEPSEYTNDHLASGNLYLLIRAGDHAPRVDRDGVWRWSQPSGIRLQISAGTTFDEALSEFKRVDTDVAGVKKRCLAHYRQIRQTRATVRMPGHHNIETIAVTAPLGLETLKLEGNQQLRHSAGWSYTDTHTSLMSMDALLYGGDFTHVENFLNFLSEPVRRGPKGQISTACHYDGLVDINQLEWKFHDTVWLALIGRLHWHRRGKWPAALYEAGREHALRILSDADPATGLFTTRGYWPDSPVRTVGRNGIGIWPAQEAGTWYEALRTFETLAVDRNDSPAVRRFGTAARKIRRCFNSLFFDPSVGFICDHVQPGTKKRHPHYSSFHLYFLDGMFGHELLDAGTVRRVAAVAFDGLHEASWKQFHTSLRRGPYHCELEFNELHWFLVLAKLFRRARHRDGLRALRESLEFYYGKLINYPETFNMQPDMTIDEFTHNGWFNNCLATRYRVIIEGLFGVSLAAHNLAIQPVGLDTPNMALENLPVGSSRWTFRYSGSGEWPASVCLDGRDHSASWVFPERLLAGGEHLVEVAFSEQPPIHPVLLETTGLRLKRIVSNNGSVTAILAGPGRAEVRFLCPLRPRVITVNGSPARFAWDDTARQAVLAVAAAKDEELRVKVDQRNG